MKPVRVLIVDDSAVIRRLLSNLLATDPEIVVAGTAGNGIQALARIPEAKPDLITLDIEMPEMDGLQFARAVRAGGPWAGLPMLAMTAHSDMETARIGREAGFTDYVAKFERELLVASLRNSFAELVSA